MLFNSLDFAIFLPIVFILYWFVAQRKLNLQNVLIAVASYVFYGWWDWRFLSLIVFSTLVDYTICRQLQTAESQKLRNLKHMADSANSKAARLLKRFNGYNRFVLRNT
jgi:alginate O-acetyltransferase complex protein AlgI